GEGAVPGSGARALQTSPDSESESLLEAGSTLPVLATACDSCKFAILISGGANSNHARYWNNLKMLYKLKVDSLGYCASNVFTLYADGNSKEEAVIPSSAVDSCTVANVQKAHQEVAKRVAECRKKGKTSTLQQLITNHGAENGHINMLGSETLSPQQLRSMLQAVIDSCLSNLIVEMVQCYGGAPADSLRSLNDKGKTTMDVSSAAGNQPHRSDTHDPSGGWATYLKAKVDSLKKGVEYGGAVRGGLAAYDSLLKAQGLESRRGKSVHWRSYPFKKYCEWQKVYVPPGGQLVVEFSGDSRYCGNVTIYERTTPGWMRKKKTWNWNIPGSALHDPKFKRRVVFVDSTSTGIFWIHNDNGEFRAIVSSMQTRDSVESESNALVYAGFSMGGTDTSALEFGDIHSPLHTITAVTDDGFELNNSPQRIGDGGVLELHAEFMNGGNPYWSNMELWLNVLEVYKPGELWVDAMAESGLVVTQIETPGEYTIPLGGVLGSQLCLNPGGGPGPLAAADFTLDAWGLRVAESGTSGVEPTPAPGRNKVYQGYPNPFNPLCTIKYEIARSGKVSLRIFDVTGAVVRTIVDGWRSAGLHTESWDGRGDDGQKLASGVYFYKLEAGDFLAARKVVLLK
ncbi:MAG: T9SS type A sorting domain-containing protein, partial [Candidatus Eisenbacteria bacterium]|nr:T9SS type A sorting domain-containing protein [Candidatus Eisenbacteria bacterium]